MVDADPAACKHSTQTPSMLYLLPCRLWACCGTSTCSKRGPGPSYPSLQGDEGLIAANTAPTAQVLVQHATQHTHPSEIAHPDRLSLDKLQLQQYRVMMKQGRG
jgi:hypothetical protein